MGESSARKQARLRAELILKVRSGLMTATEAAQQLGVSRKTYYKWEKRALGAMLAGLSERDAGRPSAAPDPQIEELKRRVQELEQELARRERTEDLRRLLKEGTEKKE